VWNWWKIDGLPEYGCAEAFCTGGMSLEIGGQCFAHISTIHRLPPFSTLIVKKTVECPKKSGIPSSPFSTCFPHGLHPLSTGLQAKTGIKNAPE
jgi:hypothetical protein